ncbi:hypothetical protein [Sphingomonas oligophenolica]|uniref:Uncharacterized protein n=1 Tax=Sphingomonas oligophenolica TaxID=301154 RepID=A0A502CUD9_9SPHN|nr:hypothetical protein [Sphingomonas oligophenolica]TPG15361.1 hypothetical protein EAH84_00685 [Sphingomonas oligophenolica]
MDLPDLQRLFGEMPPNAYTGSSVIVRNAFEGLQLGINVRLTIAGKEVEPTRLDYDPTTGRISIWLADPRSELPEHVCEDQEVTSVRTSPEPL